MLIDDLINLSSSDEYKEIIVRILNEEIPVNLMELTERYEVVGGKRNKFLWKWIWKLSTARNPGFMFSSVPDEETIKVADLKFKLCLFDVLVDDIADKYQDEKLLNLAIKIPLEENIHSETIENLEFKEYLHFSMEVWNIFLNEIKKAPRWEEFKDIFMFDLKQTLNSFSHSFLINKNINLINLTESKIYGCHNMIFFLFSDIDILFSPQLNKNELSWIREMVWRTQQMARIGNWISTWEREINENDFSSGIFGFLLTNNIITTNELEQCKYNKNIKNQIADKIRKSKVEEHFLNEWQKYYDYIIKELYPKIKSVDVNNYLDGLELLMKYHLASRGRK